MCNCDCTCAVLKDRQKTALAVAKSFQTALNGNWAKEIRCSEWYPRAEAIVHVLQGELTERGCK